MKKKSISDLYLNYFLKYSKKLEDLYLINNDEYSKEWIDKKVLLSKQALSLYKFGNELILNKFKNNLENVRLKSFYLDLIISKLKHSIFTETPKTELLDTYSILYKEDIAFTAQRLKTYNGNDKMFYIEFQRFIFKTFLMYDFIYYNNHGIFTRFKLDEKLFNSNRDIFSFNCSTFRDFGGDIIKKYLINTLKYYNINSNNPYKTLVELAKKDKIYTLEPFSYYLAYKIWKFSRMIRNTLEFLNQEEHKKHKDNFHIKIKDYMQKNLEVIDDFYNNKINNLKLFELFYEFDKPILEFLMKDILPEYKENFLENKFSEGKQKKYNDKSLQDIMSKTIDNEVYKKYKFHRLLEDKNISIDNITYLVDRLSDCIDNEKYNDYDIVAMLRSGILSAHMINVSKGLNKIIYMFSSYPYLSILPRTANSVNNKIVVIDESIKSGFSFRLFVMYKKKLLRLYNNQNFKYKLLTFSNFLSFNKDDKNYNLDYLVDIKIVDKKLCIDKDKIVINDVKSNIFDWYDFLDTIKDIDKDEFRKTAIVDNRLDITRILSISKCYFQIGKTFAKEIKNSQNSADDIILYSSTDEGIALCYVTAFVFKTLYNDKNIILGKEKAIENKQNGIYFIDMSIDTMHTIKRTFRIDFKDENFSYLNKALVVYKRKNIEIQDNKIYSIDFLGNENV